MDSTAPVSDTVILTTGSATAWVSGDTVYYGTGSGAFTVTVTVTDSLAGLAGTAFPDTVSQGDVYTHGGALTATVEHAYAFDVNDTASGIRRQPIQSASG